MIGAVVHSLICGAVKIYIIVNFKNRLLSKSDNIFNFYSVNIKNTQKS